MLWLFQEAAGAGSVSKKELFRRLEIHSLALTERYNDVVYAWGILNEVIDTEKGTEDGFRLSDWYAIGSREIYEFAFKTMGQVALYSQASRLGL